MTSPYKLEDLNRKFPEIKFMEHLTDGGQKIVYKAEYKKTIVIAKIFVVDKQKKILRAIREIKCMKQIDSPYFVKLIFYKRNEIDGKPIILMVEEYVKGKTLQDVIEEKKHTGRKLAIHVLEVLIELLKEFDKKLIIHRDIKPNNIIICSNGDIKLLDLGIARIIDDKSITSTGFGLAPGTPPYSAPELLLNNKNSQDVRTDMFSVGIVFFETLTGVHPFEDNDMDYAEAILNNQKASLLEFVNNTPINRQIAYIFEVLTKFEPFERFRKPEYVEEEIIKLKELLK